MSETIYKKGRLYEIQCDQLQPNPDQPRKFFERKPLEDLATSVKDHGLLQPVLFCRGDEEKLLIVAGERRLQAAKEAGMKSISAIFVEGNYSEIALVENLLRQDLTAIEVAEALDRIMKEHRYNQERLTAIIGKSKSTVSEILSLNRLPEEVRNECRNDPSTSRKTLIAIAKKKTPKGMLTAYKKYKERSLSAKKPKGQKGQQRTWQEKFVFKSDALTTLIADMDFGTLDTPTRDDLISRIEELKKTTAKFLAKIKAAPVEDTTPPESSVLKNGNRKEKRSATAAPAKREEKKASTGDKFQTIMLDLD